MKKVLLGRAIVLPLIITGALVMQSLTFAGEVRPRSPVDSPGELGKYDFEKFFCGPNCTYALLKIYGKNIGSNFFVPYETPDFKGMSILEIRDQLTAHGLPSDVRNVPLDDLPDPMLTPMIVYLADRNSTNIGHYMVLLSIKHGSINLFDPVSATSINTTPAHLKSIWSGYLLVPRTARSVPEIVLVTFLVASAGLGLVVAFLYRAKLKFRRQSAGKGS